MRRAMRWTAATAAAAFVAACGPAMRAATGGETITVRDAQNTTVGTALLIPAPEGVQVVLQVSGLAPGTRAVHLHETGRCDPPDFQSAGGHFDPTDREHGFHNPRGHHVGDLPNLEVGQDGRGVLNAVARGATLAGTGDRSLRRPGGTALVIHAGADDYQTDPAGDSGPRIACGVIPPAP